MGSHKHSRTILLFIGFFKMLLVFRSQTDYMRPIEASEKVGKEKVTNTKSFTDFLGLYKRLSTVQKICKNKCCQKNQFAKLFFAIFLCKKMLLANNFFGVTICTGHQQKKSTKSVKVHKSVRTGDFIVLVLLSTSVKRVGVSPKQDSLKCKTRHIILWSFVSTYQVYTGRPKKGSLCQPKL